MENDIADFNRVYEDALKPLKLPQKLRKDYRIVDCLKESDLKNIYLLQAQDGTLVVLKQYHAPYTALLQNEYRINEQLERCKRCSVPKNIDYWTDENHAFLLREYIAGESLLSLYEDGYFDSDRTVLQMSIELCKIIEALHSEKPPIIHRDIKPENFIWNSKEEKLYLVDCDSARFYKDGQERDTLFLGTPTHAAPEAYGYAQCDVRSDVFGIGKTMLYMCCGRTDDRAVKECVISKDLHRIIKKCTAFSPQERYSQVRLIHRDLRKLYEQKYPTTTVVFKAKYAAGMLAAVLVAFSFGIAVDRSVSRVETGADQPSDVVVSDAPSAEESDTSLISSGESLAESADRIVFDVSGYREEVDEILTCYYELDMDGMGAAYDRLFTKLYAAEDLKALEWTDISKMEEIPEKYYERPWIYRVCDPLACYDGILYTKIGHFSDYAGAIYGYMDFNLNDNTKYPDFDLYRYCNGDAAVREETYKESLIEVINCGLRGVIDQDGLEVLRI